MDIVAEIIALMMTAIATVAVVVGVGLTIVILRYRRTLGDFRKVQDIQGYKERLESSNHELERKMELVQQEHARVVQDTAAKRQDFQALHEDIQAKRGELSTLSQASDLHGEILRLEHQKKTKEGELAHVQEVLDLDAEFARLKQEIKTKKSELVSVEEALDLQEFGLYQVRYGFENIERYVHKLSEIRNSQKELVKGGTAAICTADWQVQGSRTKGTKMVKEQQRLMLRAFNGECDATISKVKYNNVERLEKRIKRSFESINKLGSQKQIFIADRYLNLKLAELYLVHEYREALQEQIEEQRQIKAQMREEQRALREVEQAKVAAEKDEKRKIKALDKAKEDLANSESEQTGRLAVLVSRLENELKDVLDRKAKAIARAQLTRSGHVYVISNIGSFGNGVYKIGLTRRLEPLERVKELGDASVPFAFDVHAMIYSEDAPALEKALHSEFADRRVNRVNTRKEFFRVTLDEIRNAVTQHHGMVTFVLEPEAEEYLKTQAVVRAEHLLQPQEDGNDTKPAQLEPV